MNTHLFNNNKNLSKENRLIFMAGPEAPEPAEAAPEAKNEAELKAEFDNYKLTDEDYNRLSSIGDKDAMKYYALSGKEAPKAGDSGAFTGKEAALKSGHEDWANRYAQEAMKAASEASEAVAEKPEASEKQLKFAKEGGAKELWKNWISGEMLNSEKNERHEFVDNLAKEFNQAVAAGDVSQLFEKYNVQDRVVSSLQKEHDKEGLSAEEGALKSIYEAKFGRGKKDMNEFKAALNDMRNSGVKLASVGE